MRDVPGYNNAAAIVFPLMGSCRRSNVVLTTFPPPQFRRLAMSYHNSRRGVLLPDQRPILRSSSRRRALQTIGTAGLATVALPWLRIGPARAAADKTLRILQWSHFVPAYDTWFDAFARQWSEDNGIQVSADHINIVDLATT